MSMNMQSTSSHSTSVQNCLTVPAMTGPRHTTGEVSSGSSRLTDITGMPVRVTTGKIIGAVPLARSVSPNILGMDGPVTSASRMAA